jgi:hypothetical protein
LVQELPQLELAQELVLAQELALEQELLQLELVPGLV